MLGVRRGTKMFFLVIIHSSIRKVVKLCVLIQKNFVYTKDKNFLERSPEFIYGGFKIAPYLMNKSQKPDAASWLRV